MIRLAPSGLPISMLAMLSRDPGAGALLVNGPGGLFRFLAFQASTAALDASSPYNQAGANSPPSAPTLS
jgi:hypothetical protein